MLCELFTSKIRIKILCKLFLNPDVSCYLRGLSDEFGVSPNSIKGELDKLSEAGYLVKKQVGRSNYFCANQKHPIFPEISSIVRKSLGIDSLVDEVMSSLGNVKGVYILDDYAQGLDSGLIDVLVVGDVDRVRLEGLRYLVEGRIKRKIRVMSMSVQEFNESRSVFMARPSWKVV